jgi:Bacterial Ig domain
MGPVYVRLQRVVTETPPSDGQLNAATGVHAAPHPRQTVLRDVPRHHFTRRWRPGAICCFIYVTLAMIVFGHFDALGATHMAGTVSSDTVEQVWWLAWTEFALLHGHNVFLAQWQNYPLGENFGVNGSMLALGVLFLPITKVFGPIVTWNVAVRFALAISATSMCLVLRRWVTWWPAAFVGGLLYGFGAYALYFADDLLFLVFVPLPPLFFLLLHEILVRQRWRAATAGALLGVVCSIQFFIWSEILVSMVVMGLITTAIFLLSHRHRVAELWLYAARALTYSLGAGVVLLMPAVLFTLLGPQNTHGSPVSSADMSKFPSDLLSAIVPSSQWLTTSGLTRIANTRLIYATPEYIGIPLIVVLVSFAVLFRKRKAILFAGAMALVAFVLSLGPRLWIDGHETRLPLPFVVFAHLPLVDGLVPVRFSLYTALFAAAMFSMGLDELWRRLHARSGHALLSPSWRAFASAVCVVIVAVVIVPLAPKHSQPVAKTNIPTFFSSAAIDAIPRGSVLLAYPYPDSSGPNLFYQPPHDILLYQAVAGMRFKLIGGYGWFPSPTGARGTTSPAILRPYSVQALFDNGIFGLSASEQALLSQHSPTDDLRTFLRRYDVATVVVQPEGADPGTVVRYLSSAIGCPVASHGVALWSRVKQRLSSGGGSDAHGRDCELPEFAPNEFKPSNGSTVSGTAILDASVREYVKVTNIDYYLSGRSLPEKLVAQARPTSLGWFTEWNTTTVPNGSYTLRCVAVGTDGSRSPSSAIHVTVKN